MVLCSVCNKDCVWKKAGKCKCGHYFSKHSKPKKKQRPSQISREIEDPELKSGGCGICSKSIKYTGKAFKYEGVQYHEECLRCEKCYGWIEPTEVVVESSKGKVLFFHEKCVKMTDRPVCGTCKKEIVGELREFGDVAYHTTAECLKCGQCSKPLTKVFSKKGKIYCSKKCWRKSALS